MSYRRAFLICGVLAIAIASTLAIASWPDSQEEQWPEQIIPETASAKVEHQRKTWASKHYSFDRWLQPYDSTSDYFGYASICNPRKENQAADAEDILMHVKDGSAHYHPVMLALCGLQAYGLWLNDHDQKHLDIALKYAEKLIEIQRDDGAFPYSFSHTFYMNGKVHDPGWTSAMAQGQALSLFSRLYHATGDESLISQGRKALRHMLTPKQEGGVKTDMSDLHPSLTDYVFFLENVVYPDDYTLNGYMFALLGLYDWANLPESVEADQLEAKNNFSEGIRTLEKILPYYEMGGITAYDLTHLTYGNSKNLLVSASYTGVHVYCLYALHSITGISVFDQYRRKWQANLDHARLNDTPID